MPGMSPIPDSSGNRRTSGISGISPIPSSVGTWRAGGGLSSRPWYGPTACAPILRRAAHIVTWFADSTGILSSASNCGIASYVGRFVQLMNSASAAPTTACRAMSTTDLYGTFQMCRVSPRKARPVTVTPASARYSSSDSVTDSV